MTVADSGGTGSPPATIVALARHARRALAATGGGTLLVDGLQTGEPNRGSAGHDVEVLLYEQHGEPRFLCEADSPVARAATRRRSAVLDVGCCRRSGCRREVSFAGRLVLLDTDEVDGTVVHVIGLALSAVTVRRPGAAGVELPLACYRESTVDVEVSDTGVAGTGTNDAVTDTETDQAGPAVPDCESLVAYAERVVRHTNQAHAAAVRAAAAGLAGVRPDLVVAAELSDLSDQGFTVHWIGTDGTHSCSVSFARVARSPGDLAVLLRSALTSA